MLFVGLKFCIDSPLNWNSSLPCRTDKGQTLKASYVHSVNPFHSVAAEMTHRFSSLENSFTIGSSHAVDPFTVVKTRFSDNGKAAMLYQHEWRPKSLITFSAEYDSKATHAANPKYGIALALKPWMWNHFLFCSAQGKNTCIVLYIFFPWAQGRLSSYHNILVNQKIKSMMKDSQVVLGRLIEPNFDKLLKKSRDHNTIFCSWISNAIVHGCIISLDISTLWCLMEIGIYVFYPLWPVDSLPW